MPLKSGVYTVIDLASNADFTKYTYNQVYAGATGTAVINGTSVKMVGGSTIDVLVKSISGTDIYVIGSPINVINGPQTLSHYPNP
jgi:hypothetical protein|tara:strand:- start:4578 stop:4832 length:255 start_codon:yes stop_codon:yes gene_type:complete